MVDSYRSWRPRFKFAFVYAICRNQFAQVDDDQSKLRTSNLRRAFVTSFFSTALRNDKCLSTNPVFSLRTISRVLLGQKEKRSERGKE